MFGVTFCGRAVLLQRFFFGNKTNHKGKFEIFKCFVIFLSFFNLFFRIMDSKDNINGRGHKEDEHRARMDQLRRREEEAKRRQRECDDTLKRRQAEHDQHNSAEKKE